MEEREYLGTVTLSTGAQVKVYMPVVGDLCKIDVTKLDAVHRMIACACNMDFEEYKKMSVIDGGAIESKLSNALDVLRPKTGGK